MQEFNSQANIDLNIAINDIIKQKTGTDIQTKVNNGEWNNLPTNFELVLDFDQSVYQIIVPNCEA